MWYVPEKDTIIEHWCGTDLNEALRVWHIAKKAGKDQLTLRSANMGHPPPERFCKIEMVWVGSKREGRWVKTWPVLEKINDKGLFWCPYCREFRKFQRQKWYYIDGKMRRDPRKQGALHCPMCSISHRDFHVRNWNPRAQALYKTEGRSRGSN
jgi:hypothetical protein